MKNKFGSRKFLITLLTVIIGILTLFGVQETTAELLYSIGMIVIPAVTYVITEGKLDLKSLRKIVDTVDEIVDKLEEEVENEK